MKKSLRPAWLAAVILGSLVCAHGAAADPIADPVQDVGALDDGTADLPASDLSGWFFSLDPQAFTSAANIATVDYWTSLVVELGNDPTLLSQLNGLGMIDSSPSGAGPLSAPTLSAATVPEPVTWVLLAGGLLLLGLYRRAPGMFMISRGCS